jgi:hypothetical protein
MIQKKKKGPRYKEEANQNTLTPSQGYSTKTKQGKKEQLIPANVESLQIQRGQAPNPHNRKVPDVKRKQKLGKSHDSTTLKSTKSSKRQLRLMRRLEGTWKRKQKAKNLENKRHSSSKMESPRIPQIQYPD